MQPEIGDKVRVEDWGGSYEGIVYSIPRDSTECFYVGAENGKVVYAKEDQIQVLFRPEYKYVNRCLYKVGDLVSWADRKCLVVGLTGLEEHNYRLSQVEKYGELLYAREQDLTLIHAAGHPEVDLKVAAEIEREMLEGSGADEPVGWYGYPQEAEVPEQRLEDPAYDF